jgi:hypothetical protein
MAIARWKDLCIDAREPEAVGPFWAAALGLRAEVLDDGDVLLEGERPEQRVWINTVPEGKEAKNRVHVDVVGLDVDALVAAGGTVVAEPGDDRTWTVVADPEGSEACVFPSDGSPPTALVVDSRDPLPLAEWWAEVLGARLVEAPDGTPRWLADVPGLPFDRLKVVPTLDERRVKNRVHWDVTTDDLDTLVHRGATVLREPTADSRWYVLADPQGNEFCAFLPEP